MEQDIDTKLYNDYLNGEKQAFEILYNKYQNRIKYFIYNIVKDNQKAEDIVQETFIYVLKNKLRDNASFKYYLYLVARSKAYNHINTEKRRNEISDEYNIEQNKEFENDVLDIIIQQETQKELLEAIEELDDKYKNAIYLVKIEGLSYKEAAAILGQTLQNTKTLVHRGKKKLREILLRKGFDKMSKAKKVMSVLLILAVTLTGIAYAVTKIYKHFSVTMNPTYYSTLDENTINNLWVGTLDLAWKELEEKIGQDKIELERENLQIVNDLNESNFTKEMLDSEDYNINVERTLTNGYKIDATLNKELHFLESFDNFSDDYTWKFGDGDEFIKYFGINNASPEKMNKNVEILFYNRMQDTPWLSNDFAIKLKTKEGDEIILYRTDDKKSFDEYYQDIKNKSNTYKEDTTFSEKDELRVPYIKINGMISYNELYGKEIKNSNGLYIYEVIQNVNFSLNEKGCNISSKSTMVTEYLEFSNEPRYCFFQDTFILFMQEANSENPYFALKVDNSDILEKREETDGPRLIDYTMLEEFDKSRIADGEYKFYEDENYEYYYPNQKTKYVQLYFKNGDMITAEEALKQGEITIELFEELLNKYEIEYTKKNK